MQITKHNLLQRAAFIQARKSQAKDYLKRFKWTSEQSEQLTEIAAKGYLIRSLEGNKKGILTILNTGTRKRDLIISYL